MKIIINIFILLYSFQGFSNSKFTKSNLKDSTVDITYLKQAQYAGGNDAMSKFLSDNIKYPEDAKTNHIEGKIIYKFYIDTDGSIYDIQVIEDKIGHGCAEEGLRVLKLMPKWKPAEYKGEVVKIYYTLPIVFKLDDYTEKIDIVYAKFPGGHDSLISYLNNASQVILNKKSSKKRILVMFNVNEKGKAQDVYIPQIKNKTLLAKLISYVENMPIWIPEFRSGKNVTSEKSVVFEF